MIDIKGLGHINIVVDSIEEASEYYQELFSAKPIQCFPSFKNTGFAKSAGFIENPNEVEVSINFLQIPSTNIILELMCYHNPPAISLDYNPKPNNLGGVSHICLSVKNIFEAFHKVKNIKNTTLINTSDYYQPCKLDVVKPDEFIFFDDAKENNQYLKAKSAAVSCEITFFYFYDKYKVLWELEETPEDIEDPALE